MEQDAVLLVKGRGGEAWPRGEHRETLFLSFALKDGLEQSTGQRTVFNFQMHLADENPATIFRSLKNKRSQLCPAAASTGCPAAVYSRAPGRSALPGGTWGLCVHRDGSCGDQIPGRNACRCLSPDKAKWHLPQCSRKNCRPTQASACTTANATFFFSSYWVFPDILLLSNKSLHF